MLWSLSVLYSRSFFCTRFTMNWQRNLPLLRRKAALTHKSRKWSAVRRKKGNNLQNLQLPSQSTIIFRKKLKVSQNAGVLERVKVKKAQRKLFKISIFSFIRKSSPKIQRKYKKNKKKSHKTQLLRKYLITLINNRLKNQP